jgi:hypothetical protein
MDNATYPSELFERRAWNAHALLWLACHANTLCLQCHTKTLSFLQVGPFMALEQSVLADQVSPAIRTLTFAWYNFLGSCCSASGALATGLIAPHLALKYSISKLDSYRYNQAEIKC